MEFYSIVIKNNLLLFQDLSSNIIDSYIVSELDKGRHKKYLFNIFYSICSSENYPEKSLNEIYEYALRNFRLFFSRMEHDYSENDIQNFALDFTLNNYNFISQNLVEVIDFINAHYIKYDSGIEIVNWCQNNIEMFRLYAYSYDLDNYRNGTITKLLEDLEEISQNHKEDLIYEIEINPVDE